jgi:hypothetical protein
MCPGGYPGSQRVVDGAIGIGTVVAFMTQYASGDFMLAGQVLWDDLFYAAINTAVTAALESFRFNLALKIGIDMGSSLVASCAQSRGTRRDTMWL